MRHGHPFDDLSGTGELAQLVGLQLEAEQPIDGPVEPFEQASPVRAAVKHIGIV